MDTLHTPKHQQQGAVLVVSLLVLLVLTLIGVSSLDGSVMEQKMASNAQTAATTFQKAESAIRQTYYTESQRPALAVKRARSSITLNYSAENDGDIASSAQIVYPANSVRAPLYNSSAGFVAHGIEIIGTASVDHHIQSRNMQGYSVFPMLP